MPYTPEFTGPIEGWVVNYNRVNHWRVARTTPWEDLMQEAYVVFLRVKRKYPELEEAKHFMALFKTAYVNHFTNLANEDTERRVEVPTPQIKLDGDTFEYEPVGEMDNEGSLAVLLRQAPREVMLVLTLFLQAPQELLDTCLPNWKGKDRRCIAGGSKKINKLLGLPEHLDVMQAVEDHFSGH